MAATRHENFIHFPTAAARARRVKADRGPQSAGLPGLGTRRRSVLRLLQHGFEPKVFSAATEKEGKKRYQESGVRAWASSAEILHSAAPKRRRARGFSARSSQYNGRVRSNVRRFSTAAAASWSATEEPKQPNQD
jgi:hypothetical protein